MGLRSLFSLLGLLLSLSAPAFGSPLQVTVSGTFNGSTPTTATSTPNGNFAASFFIDSNPVITTVLFQPNAAFSGAAYSLNGQAVTPSFQRIIPGPSSLQLCFSTDCGGQSLLFETGQPFFDGATITPGSYTVTLDRYYNGYSYNGSLASVSNLNITPVSVTPEPSSMVLLATGLVGLCGAARRRYA